jgi:hypothetical protein
VRAPVQRIDLLIVAVLVVAGIGSAVGVLAYEDDRRASFRVAWAASDQTVEVPLDADGSGMTGTLDVSERNVTRALWTVTVRGGPARLTPIEVRVDVVAPDNTTGSVEGELPAGPTSSVAIEVPIELGPVPTTATWEGATLDDARARLAAASTTTNGTGTWTIRVALALGGPVGAPESVTATAAATFTTYAATLALETPEVARG